MENQTETNQNKNKLTGRQKSKVTLKLENAIIQTNKAKDNLVKANLEVENIKAALAKANLAVDRIKVLQDTPTDSLAQANLEVEYTKATLVLANQAVNKAKILEEKAKGKLFKAKKQRKIELEKNFKRLKEYYLTKPGGSEFWFRMLANKQERYHKKQAQKRNELLSSNIGQSTSQINPNVKESHKKKKGRRGYKTTRIKVIETADKLCILKNLLETNKANPENSNNINTPSSSGSTPCRTVSVIVSHKSTEKSPKAKKLTSKTKQAESSNSCQTIVERIENITIDIDQQSEKKACAETKSTNSNSLTKTNNLKDNSLTSPDVVQPAAQVNCETHTSIVTDDIPHLGKIRKFLLMQRKKDNNKVSSAESSSKKQAGIKSYNLPSTSNLSHQFLDKNLQTKNTLGIDALKAKAQTNQSHPINLPNSGKANAFEEHSKSVEATYKKCSKIIASNNTLHQIFPVEQRTLIVTANSTVLDTQTNNLTNQGCTYNKCHESLNETNNVSETPFSETWKLISSLSQEDNRKVEEVQLYS